MTTFKNVSATIVAVALILVVFFGGLFIYNLFLPWMQTVISIGIVLFIGFTIYEKVKEEN